MMDMRYTGPNGEIRSMEEIPKETISEFTLKRHLNKGSEIRILLTKYTIADKTIRLAAITLEKQSNVREVNGEILADLMFEYYEYQYLEPYGKVITRNGLKLIETTVCFTKEDVIAAGVRPLEMDH